MHDQADKLRQLVRDAVRAESSLAPGAPVIALSGAHAGVGVTTIAHRLARELARLGKQVVIIDANLDSTRLSSHSPSPDQAWSGLGGTLADVLTGKRRAVEILSEPREGVRRLAAARGYLAPPLDREALVRFDAELAALARQCDVVLIDAGHGMNAWVDRLWQVAQQVLLVSTPDSQALLGSYTAVKLSQHDRLHGKLRLLTNRTLDEPAARGLATRFAETCQQFLGVATQPPAFAPAAASGGVARDEPLLRAIRLLAADLVCDFRATALRLLRYSDPSLGMHQAPRELERAGASTSLADSRPLTADSSSRIPRTPCQSPPDSCR